MKEATIAITGMSCGHCVAGVKGALERLDGVEVGGVAIGSATVEYDAERVTPERIVSAIEAAGYDARIDGGGA